jgi:hypothetical protein
MDADPPDLRPLRPSTWILVYAALLLVVLVAYHGTLSQFFIADDLTYLHVFRDPQVPLWRYLDPTSAYSDPVTLARYLPVRVYAWLALQRSFGFHPAPYHVTAIAVHAANALLVGGLARSALRSSAVGALSALLFAVSRVNAQNVCWATCITNLLSATLLFASVALYLHGKGRASWVLGPILLVASLLCRPDALVTVALFFPLWVRDVLLQHRQDAARFALVTFAGVVAALALSAVSLRYFPEPKMALGFSPRRFLAFVAALFVPYAAPLAVKAAVCAAVVVFVARSRSAPLLLALFGIALGGLFWTVVVYLPLMPRYLYVYTALSAVVLAAVLLRACQWALAPLGERRTLLAAIGAGLLVAAWNVRAVWREDIVWFDYLSGPTAALARLQAEQRAAGASTPLRVRLHPHSLLGDRDTAFFAPELSIVKGGDAEVVVNVETDRYARYYGADLGGAYWYYPWIER